MTARIAWRITSANRCWSSFGHKRAKNLRRPCPPAHHGLCAQLDERGRTRHVFAAEGLNERWMPDTTEHKTAEVKSYMCAIKRASSGRVVGYSIDTRMTSRLVVRAIENAAAMRGNVVGCIVGSGWGSEFRSCKVLRVPARHGLVGSMGRVGAGEATTRRWNPSSCSCRKTSLIAVVGRHEPSRGSRSSPGSKGPIAAGGGRSAGVVDPGGDRDHHNYSGRANCLSLTVTFPCSRPKPCSPLAAISAP